MSTVLDEAGERPALIDAKEDAGGTGTDQGAERSARDPSSGAGPRPIAAQIIRREMSLIPESFDPAEGTCDIVASTGAPVRRRDWDGDYVEVLNVDPASVRLDRLNAGAPLLDAHDYYSGTQAILGAVIPGTARVENGQVKARVKFSRSDAGQRASQDVQDGVLRHVSVGYVTHRQEIDDTRSPQVRTATDWEPYEISAVPMPADPGAGFRSTTTELSNRRALPANTEGSSMTTATTAPAADTRAAVDEKDLEQRVNAQVQERTAAIMREERERSAAITATARKLGLSEELAEEHVAKGTSLDQFRALAIEEAAKLDRTAPTSATGPWPVAAPAIGRTAAKREPEKGEMAGRIIRCVAAFRRTGVSPVEIAGRLWGDELLARAMAASVGSAGGFMVPEQYAGEIIELLRPTAVIRKMNPVVLPMPGGNLSVPRLSAGAQANYVGENADIKAGDPATQQVKLSARKLAAIVPISNDFLRFSSPSADIVVRDDSVTAIAVAEDQAFIRGSGSQFTPKGIRNWLPAANVIAANGTINVANTVNDLNKLINAVTGPSANARMLRPGWLFSWRTRNFLYALLNANGQFVFRDEMNQGKLLGFPFAVTNNIPNNLGSGSDSEIYLIDFADVVIGEVPGLIIDVSQEASYTYDGTNFVSSFSQDQTVIRLIEEHDLAMRHSSSGAVLNGVQWQ